MTYVNQKDNKNFNWDDFDTARKNMKCEIYDDFQEFVEENKENAISMFNALEHNDELKGAQPRKSELPAIQREDEDSENIDNKVVVCDSNPGVNEENVKPLKSELPALKMTDENSKNIDHKVVVCDSNPGVNEENVKPLKSELPAGLQHLNIKYENDKNPGDNRNNNVPTAISLSDEVLSQIECIENDPENGAIVKADTDLAARNVMLEWSTVVLTSKNRDMGAGAVVAPPRAYVFKDIYQQKREEKQRMLQNEERKLREFHSRPAPNFKELHKQNRLRPVVHQVTCPATPANLKTWRATEEKVKKKREELVRQQEVQRPKPRPIDYLKEQPFQPKHDAPTGLEQKPFRLFSDERVKQRREYNAVVQRAQVEKAKQEQEERMKREMEELKQIRKMTQFKARPNPFK